MEQIFNPSVNVQITKKENDENNRAFVHHSDQILRQSRINGNNDRCDEISNNNINVWIQNYYQHLKLIHIHKV